MPGPSSGYGRQEGSETAEVDTANHATALYTLPKIVTLGKNSPKADGNRVSSSNDEDKRVS